MKPSTEQCIYAMAGKCFLIKLLAKMKVREFLLTLCNKDRHCAYTLPLPASNGI